MVAATRRMSAQFLPIRSAVHLAPDQRAQPLRDAGAREYVEPFRRQIPEARDERVAEARARREDMAREAPRVGVLLAHASPRLVHQETVKDVGGFVDGGGNRLCGERRIPVGHMRVCLDSWVDPVLGVHQVHGFAPAVAGKNWPSLEAARPVPQKVAIGSAACASTTMDNARGRLVFGIFAALAEFEQGLKAARARGRNGGRKFALSKAKVRLAQAAMANRDTSVTELCRETRHQTRDALPVRRAAGPVARAGREGPRRLNRHTAPAFRRIPFRSTAPDAVSRGMNPLSRRTNAIQGAIPSVEALNVGFRPLPQTTRTMTIAEPAFTLGVEEEYLLVDMETGLLFADFFPGREASCRVWCATVARPHAYPRASSTFLFFGER